MLAFLKELAGRSHRVQTVILMDVDQMEPPQQFEIRPRSLLFTLVGGSCGLALLLAALVLFTPLRDVLPGYGARSMRKDARLNAVRLASLQDSLRAEHQYLEHLRQLVTGEADSSENTAAEVETPLRSAYHESSGNSAGAFSSDWFDHQQPALSVERLVTSPSPPIRLAAADRYISTLKLPVLPPVEGFVTRGFDARTGHFAVDIAVEEGTVVRSIGDGYVIFADWTQEGGEVVAVQHADGYVSIYKHNQRLLKRVGERVRNHEAIALSGNSGEVTTGPHLHFELWENGLAQDPRSYVLGW
ncbi:MAG TPA: M23 family metallopeptidase [Rhodothermales bacterium]|nr:M23 family metallopeptidase [Rhodothermales bacterium]